MLWAADLFLQRMDAPRRAAFDKAVKAGQVALNGLYLNVLSGLARPEELVQATRFATQLSERLGVPIDTAMISDIPGHTWGLVPALAQAGIRYFSTSPNFFDRIGTTQVASADQPFWWVGPSGREKVLTWNTWMGYALSHTWNAKLTDAHVAEYLDHLEQIALSVRHHLHPLVRPRRQRRARGRPSATSSRTGTPDTAGRASSSATSTRRSPRSSSATATASPHGAATGRRTGRTARDRRRARPR